MFSSHGESEAWNHAITDLSSGGICSFNAVWQLPEDFSRVVSCVGSFTSIQRKENPANPGEALKKSIASLACASNE